MFSWNRSLGGEGSKSQRTTPLGTSCWLQSSAKSLKTDERRCRPTASTTGRIGNTWLRKTRKHNGYHIVVENMLCAIRVSVTRPNPSGGPPVICGRVAVRNVLRAVSDARFFHGRYTTNRQRSSWRAFNLSVSAGTFHENDTATVVMVRRPARTRPLVCTTTLKRIINSRCRPRNAPVNTPIRDNARAPHGNAIDRRHNTRRNKRA